MDGAGAVTEKDAYSGANNESKLKLHKMGWVKAENVRRGRGFERVPKLAAPPQKKKNNQTNAFKVVPL